MKYITCMFDTLYLNNLRNITFYSFPIDGNQYERIICYGVIKDNNLIHFIQSYKYNISSKDIWYRHICIDDTLYKCIVFSIVDFKQNEDDTIASCAYSYNTTTMLKYLYKGDSLLCQ